VRRCDAPLRGDKDYFTIGGSWATVRAAKRLYTRLGFAERVDIIENDAPHNYDRPLREGIARWMSRWLLKKDEPIVEPATELLTDQEALCTPRQGDAASRRAVGVRSQRRLRGRAGPAPRRSLGQGGSGGALGAGPSDCWHPQTGPVACSADRQGEIQNRRGYRIETLELRPEEGIVLPALVFVPEKPTNDRIVLYVHEKGNEAARRPAAPSSGSHSMAPACWRGTPRHRPQPADIAAILRGSGRFGLGRRL